MTKQTINISGMSCSNCADMVAENILHLDGVQSVKVNLDKNAAMIQYDAEKVGTAEFKETVEATGYGFEGVK